MLAGFNTFINYLWAHHCMDAVKCAVKGIIMKGDTFLVLKQVIGGNVFWDLPGGKVEYGETPYETLHREIKEETGLEIEIGDPVGMWWFFRLTDKVQVVCSTFLCIPMSLAVTIKKNKTSDSIEEFRWVTKEEFLSSKFKVSHESLKHLINKAL